MGTSDDKQKNKYDGTERSNRRAERYDFAISESNAAFEIASSANFSLPDELSLMAFERNSSLGDVVSLGQVSRKLQSIFWTGIKACICPQSVRECLVRVPEDVIEQHRLSGRREAARLRDVVGGKVGHAGQS